MEETAGEENRLRQQSPKPIIIVDYDPAWPAAFEHVGSTAVPGLAGKPIIDIDIVIRDRGALSATIRGLASLGYRHEGDLGIAGREAFSADGATDVPRDGSSRVWPEHHLYVCALDCIALRQHLRLRDWLRSHPETAAEYGELKRRLAETYRNDREGYTNAKTEFIERILVLAE